MNLSICIPIYQSDIRKLVSNLIEQSNALEITSEICIIDDASDEEIQEKNREYLKSQIDSVRYEELPKNIGRAAIRNRLAEMARGENILFLDSDIEVHEFFLERYLPFLQSGVYMVCGGCEYQCDEKQIDHQLRCTYGKEIEQIKISKDGKVTSPVMGANLLMSKSVFSEISFDENLNGYGYEDYLFAQDFEASFGQSCQTIWNPVIITEVDDNGTFIEKTNQAMQNLAYLVKQNRFVLTDNLRIYMAYQELKQKGLVKTYVKLFPSFFPIVSFFLNQQPVSLRAFQAFKLFLFCKSMLNNNEDEESFHY